MLCLIQQRAINSNALLLPYQGCHLLFHIFAFSSLFLRADGHWNLQYGSSIPAHAVAGALSSNSAVAGPSVALVWRWAQCPWLPPCSHPSLLCHALLWGSELSAATTGFFLHCKTPGMVTLGSLPTILTHRDHQSFTKSNCWQMLIYAGIDFNVLCTRMSGKWLLQYCLKTIP